MENGEESSLASTGVRGCRSSLLSSSDCQLVIFWSCGSCVSSITARWELVVTCLIDLLRSCQTGCKLQLAQRWFCGVDVESSSLIYATIIFGAGYPVTSGLDTLDIAEEDRSSMFILLEPGLFQTVILLLLTIFFYMFVRTQLPLILDFPL